MNVFSTQQVTDDTYSGTDKAKAIIGRYKTLGAGPFISYKIPGQNARLNFQMNNNFDGKKRDQCEKLPTSIDQSFLT
jgi:hypothetical protein